MFKQVGIIGFPGLYAGANVELDSQITLWNEMDLDVHVVPTHTVSHEPLLQKTLKRTTVHEPMNYKALKGMPVISFCNDVFLRDLEKIKEHVSKTIFVNCMTWLFEAEKEAHKKGQIDLFLYQTNHTQQKLGKELAEVNSSYNWQVFTSWFDLSNFTSHWNRPNDKFRFGRISREDADKFSADTLFVYETMVAPVLKSGIILGFNDRTKEKIGQPPEWIRTYPGLGITQQEFYAHCSTIIQKSDTYENWPRVGMEAMASGSVLIVDNLGGWTEMIEHGVTGWLCDHDRDFIYYASRMAYEIEEREQMARRAFEHLHTNITNKEKSIHTWKEAFEC